MGHVGRDALSQGFRRPCIPLEILTCIHLFQLFQNSGNHCSRRHKLSRIQEMHQDREPVAWPMMFCTLPPLEFSKLKFINAITPSSIAFVYIVVSIWNDLSDTRDIYQAVVPAKRLGSKTKDYTSGENG
jgi:hypothetical protein